MRGGHGPRNPFFIHFLSLAVYLTQRESWWSEKSPQGPSHKTCLSTRWDFDPPPLAHGLALSHRAGARQEAMGRRASVGKKGNLAGYSPLILSLLSLCS